MLLVFPLQQLPDLETFHKEGALGCVDFAELGLHVFRGKECQMFVHDFAPNFGKQKYFLKRRGWICYIGGI